MYYKTKVHYNRKLATRFHGTAKNSNRKLHKSTVEQRMNSIIQLASLLYDTIYSLIVDFTFINQVIDTVLFNLVDPCDPETK